MTALAWTFLLALARVNSALESDSSRTGNGSFLPEFYDHNSPPADGEDPVEVSVDVQVAAVRRVSPLLQEIELECLLTVIWEDGRLEAPEPLFDWLIIESETAKRLWIPPLEFRNHPVPPPSVLAHRVSWKPINRTVKTVTRFSGNFSCRLRTSSFPLDSHTCRVQVQTTVLGSEQKVTLLPTQPVFESTAADLLLPEFRVTEYSIHNCTDVFYGRIRSCLEMSFRLRRHLGHFGLTLYAPSLLLVLLTCSFFWSPIHEILGRVTVHVTCLLILCAWVNEFPDNLPTDVSLSTALDVWLFGCFILVSASLLQFSVAHFLWRRKESKAAQRQPIVFKHGPSRSFFHEPPPLLQESETSTLLDRLSRFVFPAAFVLFNAIYWNGYCKEDRRHA